MAGFGQYTPSKVIITFFNSRIVGFAEDTIITITRLEDAFVGTAGAGGDVVRVQNMNQMGEITFNLLPQSPSNDILSVLADQDEQFGLGVGTFLMVDLLSTTQANAEKAWIKKRPDIERSKSVGQSQWVLQCASLDSFSGGSLTF